MTKSYLWSIAQIDKTTNTLTLYHIEASTQEQVLKTLKQDIERSSTDDLPAEFTLYHGNWFDDNHDIEIAISRVPESGI